jgi:hypothetical protein
MKNYLSLSNLTTSVKRIVPSISCKCAGKKTKKENAFVVLNSDNDYGFYMRRLAKELERYPELSEIPKILRTRSLKNIETGNLIVFGDATGGIDYDYRVEKDAKNLDHLDGRRFKAYDIINDFDKVIKKLKAYADDNNSADEIYLAVGKKAKKVETFDVEINVNVHKGHPIYRANIAVLRPEILAQKVTVFNNWVKVGYNQYDIYCDLFGNEFIYVDGVKFFVEQDRYGRKYLAK